MKDWSLAKPDRVAEWENLVLTGIRGAPVCDYDVDNLKWSGKAIMNIIYLDLWESTDKYLGFEANEPDNYAEVISKIHQVRYSAIHNIVDGLRNMYLIKEPGQDVNTFGYQATKKTCCIVGSGSAPKKITYIFAQ